MRTVFVNTLFEQAKKNKNIILLTGDMGFSVFEKFIDEYPKQYLNSGVAEQNMTGVSAGMAMEGKIPFIYSIIPFITMRNFEQVRNDICYQNLNVKIIGIGAGFSYGTYGHTHYGLEDVGILRTLPNLTIFSPGDPIETKMAVLEAIKIKGPVYIRLGKSGEPIVHKKKIKFKSGKGIIIKDGKDLTIFATGTMLNSGLKVSETLEKEKLSIRLVSMHTIKPVDLSIIIDSAQKTKAIFTIEEHSIIGGLGSCVAEIMADNGFSKIFKRFGTSDKFNKFTGSSEYMKKLNHLSDEAITNIIIKLLNKSHV